MALLGAAVGVVAIVNFIVLNSFLPERGSGSTGVQLKSKQAFLGEPIRSQAVLNQEVVKVQTKKDVTVPEIDFMLQNTRASSTTTPRRLSPVIPRRTVSHTGAIQLEADFLYNSTNGSFWLPRPPDVQNLIRGYEVRHSTSNFAPWEYSKKVYNNEQGFMTDSHIRIINSHGYNAGDFFAFFIAPIISGRAASFRSEDKGNRNSISVVGSILGWGIRYMWAPGLMYENKQTLDLNGKSTTEVVFATRGPRSFEDFSATAAKGSLLYKVYGDSASLLSWYYQPHDQTKKYPLCVLPHHTDWDHKAPFLTRMNEWWDGPEPKRINIMQPLFKIADEIVRCEFILSSSLHGIIFSDSYGVPNAHMKYKNLVFGEHYKFNDYYDSVGRVHDWLDMEDESLWKSGKVREFIKKQKEEYDISMDLYPLWESCPMHAEAYNRSREQHMEWSQMFIREFDDLLEHRPKTFEMFHTEISKRLGVSEDG